MEKAEQIVQAAINYYRIRTQYVNLSKSHRHTIEKDYKAAGEKLDNAINEKVDERIIDAGIGEMLNGNNEAMENIKKIKSEAKPDPESGKKQEAESDDIFQ